MVRNKDQLLRPAWRLYQVRSPLCCFAAGTLLVTAAVCLNNLWAFALSCNVTGLGMLRVYYRERGIQASFRKKEIFLFRAGALLLVPKALQEIAGEAGITILSRILFPYPAVMLVLLCCGQLLILAGTAFYLARLRRSALVLH